MDCEFLVVQERGEGMVITEVYNVLNSTPPQTYEVGNWSATSGLSWIQKTVLERRRDLKGITVRAGILNFATVSYITKYEGNKPVEIGGYSADIWSIMEEKLNFTTDYYTPEDGAYGSQDENGTWSGLVGMLIYNKVDVLLVPMVMSTSRVLHVEVFRPMFTDSFRIFIKSPDGEAISLKHFLEPFSLSFWVVILVTKIIFAFIMNFTWRVRRKYVRSANKDVSDIITSLFLIFGVFCQQDHDSSTRSWAYKLVVISAYVTAMVVFIAYSATFIAFLAINRIKLPFTDLEGFLKDGKYLLGMLPNSADRVLFMNSSDPVMTEIYRKQVLPDKYPPEDEEEGLNRVCEHKEYALMGLELAERLLRPTLSCTIIKLPGFYFPVPLGYLGRKYTPLRHILNYYFVELQEKGISRRNEDKLFPLKFKSRVHRPTIEVTLEKVMPILTILFFGLVVSVVCLIMFSCFIPWCKIK